MPGTSEAQQQAEQLQDGLVDFLHNQWAIWGTAVALVTVGVLGLTFFRGFPVVRNLNVLLTLWGHKASWSMPIWVFWLFVTPCYIARSFLKDEIWAGIGWALIIPIFAWNFLGRIKDNFERLRAGTGGGPVFIGGGGGGRVVPDPGLAEVKTFNEEDEVGSDIGDMEFPEYWTNQRRKTNQISREMTANGFDQMVYVNTGSHQIFDELLNKTYKPVVTQDRLCPKSSGKCAKTPGGCPCVRPGGDPGLPTGYVVRRIIRVEDSGMWKRYAAKRDSIRENRSGSGEIQPINPPAITDELAHGHRDVLAYLEADLNEVYLWHGTGVRVALAIAQNDFDINLAGTNAGTMYGRGAYLTESSVKADEYASDEPGEYYDGVFALLLVRACLGRYYYTTTREPQAGDKVQSGECDSVLGDRLASVNTFREFVVYDADQVYPEFVVLYSRIFAADDESAVRAGAQLPFHMELPVYWSNCHCNPHVENFACQYKVRQQTQALLQKLVSYTATQHSEVEVVEAHRVEVSGMWNRYVDFRRSVQARGIPTRVVELTSSVNSHALGLAGGSAPATIVIKQPAERCYNVSSDSYQDFTASKPFPAKVKTISIGCEWKDQDWGNKKGRMRATLTRGANVIVVEDLFGVCRSSGKTGWKMAFKSLVDKDPVVSHSQAGDILKVQYVVGGGGGHKLFIKEFKCIIVFESIPSDDESSASEADDIGQKKATRKILGCLQPNELDGMEESGHVLTSVLLDDLDVEDAISSENLDISVNEMFLWHGTSREAAESIVRSGFRIGHVAHGVRFGQGAYFAEDLSKSLSYTKPDSDVHYVLLCRTTCGELFYTEENYNSDAHNAARRDGKDSVLANPKGEGPREFIVLQECQVYPEFILHIKLS